jgi:hypothetical protein
MKKEVLVGMAGSNNKLWRFKEQPSKKSKFSRSPDVTRVVPVNW